VQSASGFETSAKGQAQAQHERPSVLRRQPRRPAPDYHRRLQNNASDPANGGVYPQRHPATRYCTSARESVSEVQQEREAKDVAQVKPCTGKLCTGQCWSDSVEEQDVRVWTMSGGKLCIVVKVLQGKSK
jgi:hypothetical protein